jgi:cysteinyl-tRNA synthetase
MSKFPDIYFQNTLTGTREKFIPLKPGEATIYSCGPTVYDYAHIGNFRSFMMSDLLTRVLTYAGYTVKKVQNITDVGHLTNDDLADSTGEDKIAKKAKAEKKSVWDVAKFFEDCFVEDEKVLRILPPSAGRPRATEFISEQIALIKDLMDKGFAYEIKGSVYFRVEKFPDYGKLSKNAIADLQAGARVDIHDDKESPLDFALWKTGDQNHLMQWDFETGEKIPENLLEKSPENKGWGFPGWHIECSAMSQKLLGKDFDIHTGGEDNIFPHHECEIAQNECSTGGKINYWLHAKHLLVDGQKMSKSKGNFFTIRDLTEQGWKGEEIRYVLLASHYRSSMNFSEKVLADGRASIGRLGEARKFFGAFKNPSTPPVGGDPTPVDKYREKFQAALADDLNTSDALAAVFGLVNAGYRLRESGGLDEKKSGEISQFLEEDFQQVFDVFPEEKKVSEDFEAEILAKITERKKAREDKDWAKSDAIREALLGRGVKLVDGEKGTAWELI